MAAHKLAHGGAVFAAGADRVADGAVDNAAQIVQLLRAEPCIGAQHEIRLPVIGDDKADVLLFHPRQNFVQARGQLLPGDALHLADRLQ